MYLEVDAEGEVVTEAQSGALRSMVVIPNDVLPEAVHTQTSRRLRRWREMVTDPREVVFEDHSWSFHH